MNSTTSLDGLLLVDKPPGCTSHDVVRQIKKELNLQSVGHAGTLDPQATGLLVLLLGEATKLSQYVLCEDKGYSLKAQLGVTTDTLDTSGKVLTEQKVDLNREQIRAALEASLGSLELHVPKFSAVKVQGKTLHREARQGKEFETPIKTMNFYDLKIRDVQHNTFECDIKCSKGSYIRSWTEHIGGILGCGAALEVLRRTWSSPFSLENAIQLDQVKSFREKPESFIPLKQVLPWPAIMVQGKDETLLKNGQISYSLKSRLKPYYRGKLENTGIQVLSQNSRAMLAILTPTELEGDFAISRVFRQ
ncbi:MAG: tRNA pseudouridine(55) synthase TruB [Bdellovibrionales bacterium]